LELRTIQHHNPDATNPFLLFGFMIKDRFRIKDHFWLMSIATKLTMMIPISRFRNNNLKPIVEYYEDLISSCFSRFLQDSKTFSSPVMLDLVCFFDTLTDPFYNNSS